jgi:F-type H+-transporting ATPase subunit delta
MIDPVTSRYAEALFDLARSRSALDAVRGDVERLAHGLADPRQLGFVFDELMPLVARRAQLAPHLASMSPLVQDFVNLVFDKRRVEVLRSLGAAFHRRDLADRGMAEGVVESARPLDASELTHLASVLGPRLGKQLVLQNRIVPELIGGLRVVVESKMIDSSLAGRLEGMRKTLLAAPLPRADA